MITNEYEFKDYKNSKNFVSIKIESMAMKYPAKKFSYI